MKKDALGCDLELSEVGSRDGLRVFAARDCRIQCDDLLVARLSPLSRAGHDEESGDAEDDEITPDEATPEVDDESEDVPEEERSSDMHMLMAVASSTGVDHHGTEMTVEALRGMANQMKAGVVYVPAHSKAEWDDVMGHTIDAEVVEGMVLQGGATGGNEDGYHLRVTVGLYPDHEKTAQLLRAVNRPPAAVGTSIGGWFTDVEFMVNEEDEVERVLIKAAELDHLATTRRPSNRESWIEGLRDRCGEMIRHRSANAQLQEDLAEPAEASDSVDSDGESDSPEQEVRDEVETRATAGVDAPEGHHWMDYKDGPVLMEGDDATHEGASEQYEFEVVEQHDPDRLKDKYKNDEDDSGYSKRENEETVSSTNQAQLDTRVRAGEDGHGPDAEKSAVPPLKQNTIEDGSMSEHIEPVAEAPVADARMDRLERSLEQLTGLVAKLAERTTVEEPVITPEQRAAELENKVQALQAKLARTMATAGRVGLANVTRERVATAGGFAGMVSRSAERMGDTSALHMVCKAQAERRDATRTNTPERGSLETDLRSVLAAALADGIINDPDASGWEG